MAADRFEPSRRARDRIRAGEGFLYVAQLINEPDVVKIGFALDPAKRVGSLGADAKTPATLLAAIPSTFAQECALHKKLRLHAVKRSRSRLSEYYPRSILSHPAIPEALRRAA